MNRVFLRVRTGLILVAALIYVMLPRRKVRENSLAIFQSAKLGDMVCTTPMFRAFKEKYPERKLIVFGSRINAEVLSGDPYINQYEILSSSFFNLVRQLRRLHVGTVCFTSPSFETAAASIFAGVPQIVGPRIQDGWSPYETRPYKILSCFITTRPHHMGAYAPREYLRLLEPLGIHTSDTTKHLVFSESAELVANTLLSKAREEGEILIGILPGAGNEIKAWAAENFAELMNRISASHPNTRFVIIGTVKDNYRRDIILSRISSTVRVMDVLDKLSVDELKAAISKLHMVIGADTGPQYIAEAFSIPTIDIVGPVDEREQPPQGGFHRVVVPNREHPQLYVMNARTYDMKEATRQANATTPQMVYAVFEDLITTLPRN